MFVYSKTIQQKFDILQIPVNLSYVYYQNLRKTRSELQEQKNRLRSRPPTEGKIATAQRAKQKANNIIHPPTQRHLPVWQGYNYHTG
jgi:hypothetical protein